MANLSSSGVSNVAGLCLYKNEGDAIKYLFLKKAQVSPEDWTMPKGQQDFGEDPQMAAVRETYEETSFLPEDYTTFFEQEIYFEYVSTLGLVKKVTIFPAKLTNVQKQVILDPKEHCSFEWVEFDDGQRRIKPEYKEAFIAANNAIVAQEESTTTNGENEEQQR